MPLNPEGPQQGDADLSIDSLRTRTRTQSQAVADHIAADPEAKAFIDDWAAPVPVDRGRDSPSD